jgi:hypothetical protein
VTINVGENWLINIGGIAIIAVIAVAIVAARMRKG